VMTLTRAVIAAAVSPAMMDSLIFMGFPSPRHILS
jgi:hypothetical protein